MCCVCESYSMCMVYGYLFLQITLMMPWKKARKLIKDDPRYKKYSDSDEVANNESIELISIIRRVILLMVSVVIYGVIVV